SAKDESWSTMALRVSLSCRISPWASTVIFLDRLPWATADETAAIPRTSHVRSLAMELTLSVRSFQTPDTPRTWAWPPSWPSVPTSRATRVTSEANEDSWSTIVFMVDLSSRISPWASTTGWPARRARATAVVTCAMLRTWYVRFRAMELTLSVRSFQTPDTPFTSARPPSLPSVPTSRATRVTSSAKDESWSTMVLRVSLSCRISPWASTVIFLDRLPWATADETAAIWRTCEVRLFAIELTLSVRSFQTPDTPRTWAWPPSWPSVPTSRPSRALFRSKEESWSTMVFRVALSCRISPWASTAILRVRSPLATAVVTCAMLRTWYVRFRAMELTLSVR